MPAFDDFLPEEREARQRELTAFLEQIYQQPAIAERTISQADQERILVEVRASLLAPDPVVKRRGTTSPRLVMLPHKKRANPVQLPVPSPLKEKDEEPTFLQEAMHTDHGTTHASGFTPHQRSPRHPFQRLVEAGIAAALITSLLLGWFAILRTQSAQGEPTPLFTYTGQPGEGLYDLEWTPDKRYLTFLGCKLVGPGPLSCRSLIWNVVTGKVTQTVMEAPVFDPSDGGGGGSMESPDGQSSLLVMYDQTKNRGEIQLENIFTGQVQQVYQGSTDPNPLTTVFSHDGQALTFVGDDGNIHVWDIAAGKITLTIRVSGIQQISWSADDRRINTQGAAGLQVWNAQTGQRLAFLANTPTMVLPYTAAIAGFSPDEQRILTYDPQAGTFAVRETSTLKVLQTLQTQVHPPAGSSVKVAWLAGGARLLLGYNQQGSLWDPATGQRIASFPFVDVPIYPDSEGGLNHIVSNANTGEGRYIACLPPGGNQWVIRDALTGAIVRTFPPMTDLLGNFWLLGDKYLIVTNTVLSHGQIYNAFTGQLILSDQGAAEASIALSRDGRYIAVGNNARPARGEPVTGQLSTVQVFAAD